MQIVVARIVKANPNVVGIKDTIADFNHVLSMQKVKEINPDFSVFQHMKPGNGSTGMWCGWIHQCNCKLCTGIYG